MTTVEPGQFLLFREDGHMKLYAVKAVRELKSGARKVTLITNHGRINEEATAFFPGGEIKPPFALVGAQDIIDKLHDQ